MLASALDFSYLWLAGLNSALPPGPDRLRKNG